jgi:exodeoxyribonuclease X
MEKRSVNVARPIIRVLDLETGPAPIMDGDRVIEPGIIEIGFQDIVSARDDLLGNPIDWELGGSGGALVNPGRPITPETSAIHNLVDADVSGAPAWGFVASRFFSDDMMEGVIAFGAHNIKTEQTLIGSELTRGLPWICTYKNAVRLWPDMASHSNGSVRYHLNPAGLDRDRASPTHRAFPDSYVTAHILLEALKLASWADLAEWSTQPILMPRCKIGKWRGDGKGTPYSEVDSGFLSWMLGKDFSEDDLYTARWHLQQREIDQRLEYERMELERQLRENGMVEQPARDTNTMELEF